MDLAELLLRQVFEELRLREYDREDGVGTATGIVHLGRGGVSARD